MICYVLVYRLLTRKILRPRQNGRHFADDILKCIHLDKNVWTSIQISLKFVPTGPIDNITAQVQIMAWHRPGDKPLCEQMMIISLTHICVTRPQWVKVPQDYSMSRSPFLNIIDDKQKYNSWIKNESLQKCATLRPTQTWRHFADDFSNAFSWRKMHEFRLRYHWKLFLWLELMIFQYWFR